MNRKKSILEQVLHGSELYVQPMPSVPLVEIVGNQRILIENHTCIDSYSSQEICIRVKYGYITINGDHLFLNYMSPEKLVITGSICCIQLNNSAGI